MEICIYIIQSKYTYNKGKCIYIIQSKCMKRVNIQYGIISMIKTNIFAAGVGKWGKFMASGPKIWGKSLLN